MDDAIFDWPSLPNTYNWRLYKASSTFPVSSSMALMVSYVASWALGTAVLRGASGGLCGLAAISSQRCASIDGTRCTAKGGF